ncbi:LPS export ABC transporter permease LptF [Methyloceanibacter sp.]|uniref:LPS export ABC transporter permease LptF n=1 Tax=Methyloceanibacter sp. TaxID=1965321 RepID=UPI002D58F29F|nr:LPS export ABC transporter permease LptF [Methyloceanibacter sp.]HZP07997.1 LPS export ABC transporter permease LptF [Methyloceanibacter sp.]
MTTLFGRYMFRQAANAFLVILLTLTSVVWLATVLKELNLITSQGQGIVLFLQMTILSLPSLIALIAPNAVLMASLYTLDRMNGDSELIVMTAAGAPVWRIGAPLIVLAAMVSVGILVINLFVTPASLRELRTFITQVRADLISQVLQPGRFSSPENGLTFHIRDRAPSGELLGLLVHDERDPKQVMSYLAERGRIINNDDGSYLVMFDGYVQRLDAENADKGVQIVAFDQNMLDLSEFAPKEATDKEYRPREQYLGDLINFGPDSKYYAAYAGHVRSELHERLSTPLYPLVFIFVVIALLAHARTTRESRWGQIVTAFGIAVGLRVAGITANNLVTLNAWATPLVYLIPVGAILIAAYLAHVRMSPELRSKLSFELRLKPKNIMIWAGRGMRTT